MNLGILFAALSAFGAATLAVFGKLALNSGLSRDNAMFYRFLLALPLLFAWSGCSEKSSRLTFPKAIRGIALGFVGIGIMASLFMITIAYLGANLTEIVFYTYPAFTAILSLVFLREQIRPSHWIWITVSLGSICLLLDPSRLHFNLIGVAVGLAMAVWYAGYLIVGSRFTKQMPPLRSSSFVAVGACGAFLLLSLFRGGISLPTGMQWIWVIGLALGSTVMQFGFLYLSLARIGASKTAFVSTLEVIFTFVLAALLLGERLTIKDAACAIGVIVSVVQLNRKANSTIS